MQPIGRIKAKWVAICPLILFALRLHLLTTIPKKLEKIAMKGKMPLAGLLCSLSAQADDLARQIESFIKSRYDVSQVQTNVLVRTPAAQWPQCEQWTPAKSPTRCCKICRAICFGTPDATDGTATNTLREIIDNLEKPGTAAGSLTWAGYGVGRGNIICYIQASCLAWFCNALPMLRVSCWQR